MIQRHPCCKNGGGTIASKSRLTVRRHSILSSLTSLDLASAGSLPRSWPLQCSNACDEDSCLPLTLHGTASPRASLSALASLTPQVQSPLTHSGLCLPQFPQLHSAGVHPATNQMSSIMPSTKRHEMSSYIIPVAVPLSCKVASCGASPWRACRMPQS